MYSTWTCVSMKPVAYWRSCTLDDDDDDELPPPDDDDDEPPPRRPPRRPPPPPPPPRPRPRWDWDWDWVLMGCVGERGRAAEDDDGSERAAPTSLLDARNESRTASPTAASQSISLLCVRVCDHSCARGDDSARYEIERSRFIITAIRISQGCCCCFCLYGYYEIERGAPEQVMMATHTRRVAAYRHHTSMHRHHSPSKHCVSLALLQRLSLLELLLEVSPLHLQHQCKVSLFLSLSCTWHEARRGSARHTYAAVVGVPDGVGEALGEELGDEGASDDEADPRRVATEDRKVRRATQGASCSSVHCVRVWGASSGHQHQRQHQRQQVR